MAHFQTNRSSPIILIDQLLYSSGCKYLYHLRVRTDVYALLTSFPTHLQLHIDQYSGSSLLLLKIYGTVPIIYKENNYNIPISIWIPPNYPHEKPAVIVPPTPDMVIKQGHTCVGSDGYVRHTYLLSWNQGNTLLALFNILIQIFSQDPPVRAVPRNLPPTYNTSNLSSSPQNSTFSSSSNPYMQSTPNSPLSTTLIGTTSPHTGLTSSVSFVNPSPTNSRFLEGPKKNLLMKIQSNLQEFNKGIREEIEAEMKYQRNLEELRKSLSQENNQLASQLEQVELKQAELISQLESTNKWIEENENQQFDLDELTQSSDILTNHGVISGPLRGFGRSVFSSRVQV
jgi:hypothetical protein